MDNNKSWSSIGQEIRDAVESALTKGDFEGLEDMVTDTVRNVTSKVGQAVSGIAGENQTQKWENATRERKRVREEFLAAQRARDTQIMQQRAPFRRIGRVSSVLYKVFGGIGTGVMGILSSVFLGLAIGNGGGWWITFFVLSLALSAFIGMICVGWAQKKRLSRAEKYLELAGNNHYINVEDLALYTNESPKNVLKEIRKMLEAGHFPQGHLDNQQSCLMLDDKIYREYLDLEKQRKLLEQEQKAQKLRNAAVKEVPKPVQSPPGQADSGAGGELEAMIAEGQEYIRKLRDLNDNIPGEEISAKLFRLENLLKEIFEALREHVEQRHQMKKFMNYYLPTTLKLVEAYEEFDGRGVKSPEVMEAKAEIEKTLDTINSAFEELLGRMLRDTAFDVTTDAQVLQTMLAKEGFTGQGVFDKERELEKVPR